MLQHCGLFPIAVVFITSRCLQYYVSSCLPQSKVVFVVFVVVVVVVFRCDNETFDY